MTKIEPKMLNEEQLQGIKDLHGETEPECDGCQLLQHIAYLEKQLAEEKKWKEEDPRMLREQIRVADVAYQSLFEVNKAANALIGSTAEERKKVVAELQQDKERFSKLVPLVQEVMQSHADHQSCDYNDCDKNPCMFCIMGRQAIDAARKET